MFGWIVVTSSWRWSQYSPLKQKELLSQTQSITLQKISNSSSTIMRTSNLTYSLLFVEYTLLNPLNAELNPICHLLPLLGAHPIFHVSRIRVNYRIIMSCLNHPRKPHFSNDITEIFILFWSVYVRFIYIWNNVTRHV
jgi:hypothetical protein